MQKSLIKNLETLGLTSKEAAIYLVLLEKGNSSVMAISEHSGIKRPTCYLVLDDLVKKGFVARMPVGRRTVFSAEHPVKVLRRAEHSLALARNIIPGLQEIMTKSGEKPQLKMLTGVSGARIFFEEVIESGHPIYYIASIEDLAQAVGQEFLDEYVKKRIEKGIRAYSIRTKSTDVHTDLYKAGPENHREIRYAPDTFEIPFMVFIYGDKVAFVSKKEEGFGFIVKSVSLSKTMKSMFDVLWAASKE